MSVDIEILRTDHKINVNDGIVDAFLAALFVRVFIVIFEAVFKSASESEVAARIFIEQGVEERIGTVGSVRMTIDNLLSKSFLNKEVAEQQVAQMVQHNLEAQKNKLYKAQ